MADELGKSYDLLAANYHLIFADWESAIDREAAVVDGLLREVYSLGHGGGEPFPPADYVGDRALGRSIL